MSVELSDEDVDVLVAALSVAIGAFSNLRDKLEEPEFRDPEVLAQAQRDYAAAVVDNIAENNALLKFIKEKRAAQ